MSGKKKDERRKDERRPKGKPAGMKVSLVDCLLPKGHPHAGAK